MKPEPYNKAVEIVDFFMNNLFLTVHGAKIASLYLVDQIIEQEKEYRYNNVTFYPSTYWVEVREQINKNYY